MEIVISSEDESEWERRNPNPTPNPTPRPPVVKDEEGNVDQKESNLPGNFDDLYLANQADKFKKYEADYSRRLMAKYFSKKNLYGGEIFDENVTIDGVTIKASRSPCTQAYAAPVRNSEDQKSNNPSTETPSNISNGKQTPKKNG